MLAAQLRSLGLLALLPAGVPGGIRVAGAPSCAHVPEAYSARQELGDRLGKSLPYRIMITRFTQVVLWLAREQIGVDASAPRMEASLNTAVRPFTNTYPDGTAFLRAKVLVAPGGQGRFVATVEAEPHLRHENASFTLRAHACLRGRSG